MPTSALSTDAYKLSMAQAGFPMRPETFYLSFRRGGPQYVPIDLEATIRELLDDVELFEDGRAFARAHGYGFTDAMESALGSGSQAVRISAAPKGCWVLEREPIVSITGPSFLVSWLEPMLLWLNHRIQLATALLTETVRPEMSIATCREHAEIIASVYEELGRPVPRIEIDEGYEDRVCSAVRGLIEIVGSPDRIFEVGMRSAVCMQHHRRALAACRAQGVLRTSNIHLAQRLEMLPVGTMGHEHVQRWGDDRSAFGAMRDMRAATPSYLLDTFDTMGSGIAAAVSIMRERAHACSIRYDSGNKFIQYLYACELLTQVGLEPTQVLEDSLDVDATRHFESLRSFTKWPADKQIYGYGGSIVAQTMTNPLTRDRVSAVYKLCDTGGEPRMKFGNEAGLGKQSVPGQPVTWRRVRGRGPVGIVAQADEPVPDDYVVLSGNPEAVEQMRLCNVLDIRRVSDLHGDELRSDLSPETKRLIDRIRASQPRSGAQ